MFQHLCQLIRVVVFVHKAVHALGDQPGGAGVLRQDGGLITEGVDGFVYEDDDPEKLAERLAWAIEHPEKLAAMRPACRELYESYYSKQAFSDSLQQVVKELTGE